MFYNLEENSYVLAFNALVLFGYLAHHTFALGCLWVLQSWKLQHGKKDLFLCLYLHVPFLLTLTACCHVLAWYRNPQAYKWHTSSINTLTLIPAVYLNFKLTEMQFLIHMNVLWANKPTHRATEQRTTSDTDFRTLSAEITSKFHPLRPRLKSHLSRQGAHMLTVEQICQEVKCVCVLICTSICEFCIFRSYSSI